MRLSAPPLPVAMQAPLLTHCSDGMQSQPEGHDALFGAQTPASGGVNCAWSFTRQSFDESQGSAVVHRAPLGRPAPPLLLDVVPPSAAGVPELPSLPHAASTTANRRAN